MKRVWLCTAGLAALIGAVLLNALPAYAGVSCHSGLYCTFTPIQGSTITFTLSPAEVPPTPTVDSGAPATTFSSAGDFSNPQTTTAAGSTTASAPPSSPSSTSSSTTSAQSTATSPATNPTASPTPPPSPSGSTGSGSSGSPNQSAPSGSGAGVPSGSSALTSTTLFSAPPLVGSTFVQASAQELAQEDSTPAVVAYLPPAHVRGSGGATAGAAAASNTSASTTQAAHQKPIAKLVTLVKKQSTSPYTVPLLLLGGSVLLILGAVIYRWWKSRTVEAPVADATLGS